MNKETKKNQTVFQEHENSVEENSTPNKEGKKQVTNMSVNSSILKAGKERSSLMIRINWRDGRKIMRTMSGNHRDECFKQPVNSSTRYCKIKNIWSIR